MRGTAGDDILYKVEATRMRVLTILGSPRRQGNTAALLDLCGVPHCSSPSELGEPALQVARQMGTDVVEAFFGLYASLR